MARSVAPRRTAAAPLPEWIRPQLTELVDQAPDGPDWLHEIKFDGYRMQARLDGGAVRLLTRTGLDWTHKYPAIAAAVSSIGARQAYLDGELCGVRPDGITSFSMIQLASDSGNAAALVFFLFDLLYRDGEDLRPRAACAVIAARSCLWRSCWSRNRASSIRYGSFPSFRDALRQVPHTQQLSRDDGDPDACRRSKPGRRAARG
jgi:hypothetical protein